MIFALAGMVFIGGIVATFIGILFEKLWGGYGPLEAAPGEKSLIFPHPCHHDPFVCALVDRLSDRILVNNGKSHPARNGGATHQHRRRCCLQGI